MLDPVALSLGPIVIRWYALAYVLGFVLGLWYGKKLCQKYKISLSKEQFDEFLTWAVLGVLLGGRLGYVLFYNLNYFLDHPSQILAIWQGGMSFHGGMLGLITAGILFAKIQKISFLTLADVTGTVAPIGLFLGRIANFINGELWGRPTGTSWGVIFERGGPLPRHPSQLYEAFLEGFVLFAVLWFTTRYRGSLKNRGLNFGIFTCMA